MEIEKTIIDCIENELKPEIRARFVYNFAEFENTNEGRRIWGDRHNAQLAQTKRFLAPPLITFFINMIEESGEYTTKEKIRELISHEIFHVLGAEHGKRIELLSRQNKLWWR